jgi:hypothetical protein
MFYRCSYIKPLDVAGSNFSMPINGPAGRERLEPDLGAYERRGCFELGNTTFHRPPVRPFLFQPYS